MKISSMDQRLLIGAATLCAVVFLALTGLLATLSTPARSDQRLADVEARLELARAGLRPKPGARHYPPDALCRDADLGVATGHALVEAAASKAGVTVDHELVVSAGSPPGPRRVAFSIDISVKGQEAALTDFLRELANRRPLIIADAVDLGTDGAEVSLRLKGRFLCHDHF